MIAAAGSAWHLLADIAARAAELSGRCADRVKVARLVVLGHPAMLVPDGDDRLRDVAE
ncbi:hypothetical protein [Microbacterium sp. 2P06AB]